MSGPSGGGGSVVIKVCGITNSADAVDAIECGADALGFNLFPGSRRFIKIKTAAEWIERLPGSTRKIAVMVNPSFTEALSTARSGLFDALQLHGQESSDFCRGLADQGVAFIKAVPVSDESSLQQPIAFSTTSILLDSSTLAGFGGTGQTFPWSLARRFIDAHPSLQVILAGGLRADNVGEAIEEARPFGVDVTTGVEASIGYKDRARLEAFIAAVRNA